MTHYITKQGLEDLKQELEDINSNKIPEILESINRALAEGDIRENSALDTAKLERDKLEFRKTEIEDILADYELIESGKKSGTARIQLGSKVKVEYLHNTAVYEVKIVGVSEANAVNGKISNESPLAKALIGHKKGDEVKVKSINNSLSVKVLEIVESV
jgi:transcription elongation factor GreA